MDYNSGQGQYAQYGHPQQPQPQPQSQPQPQQPYVYGQAAPPPASFNTYGAAYAPYQSQPPAQQPPPPHNNGYAAPYATYPNAAGLPPAQNPYAPYTPAPPQTQLQHSLSYSGPHNTNALQTQLQHSNTYSGPHNTSPPQTQLQHSVSYSGPHNSAPPAQLQYSNSYSGPHQATNPPAPQLQHSNSLSGPHQQTGPYPQSPNMPPHVSPNMQASPNMQSPVLITMPSPVAPNLQPPSPMPPPAASPNASPLLTQPAPRPSGAQPPDGSYTPFPRPEPADGSYTPFTAGGATAGASGGAGNAGDTVHVAYIPTSSAYAPYKPLPGVPGQSSGGKRDSSSSTAPLDIKGLPAPIPKLQPLSEPLEVVPGYWVDQQVTLVLKETFDNFTVVDTDNLPVLDVKSRLSVSRKKVFYDTYGNVVFNLKGRKHQFTGTDENKREILKVSSPALKIDTKLEASVVNALTHRTETLTITGEWPGDIVEIKWQGHVIAVIIRKLGVRDFFGQNTYLVTVAPGVDLVAMAALCICVDERREAT